MTCIKAKINNTKKSYFISDSELEDLRHDLLDYSNESKRFAELLLNGGSTESVVYGIDAPWGAGKSTFINYCICHLDENYSSKVVVFKFDPLRYADQENVIEKFVEGLISSIQNKLFLPEIRPLVHKYSRFVSGKIGFSWVGTNLHFGSYGIDQAFEDLEIALKNLDCKIIVVVDDLDRLDFSAVRNILFAIRKSFVLPNISYLLCYDTDNLMITDNKPDDSAKVGEFLEKFVNVKISLFVRPSQLSNYLSENIAKVFKDNLHLEPKVLESTKQALMVIQEICKSTDFHNYQPFIGDIRKLKRVINTYLLLEIQKTDFLVSDINQKDLLLLILIYVNFPNIFRKIYCAETDGKCGFFSVVNPYDDGYPDAGSNIEKKGEKNSVKYTEYREKLSDDKKFLLDQLFAIDIRRKEGQFKENVTDENRHTWACFNGRGGGRNLEVYLDLIVRLARPIKINQFRFFMLQLRKILDGTEINDIFAQEEFAAKYGEDSHQQLWRIVVNSANNFNGAIGRKFIDFLLQQIPTYSLMEIPDIGIGLRDTSTYYLLKILDSSGWKSASGNSLNNSDENVVRIAEQIFGEMDFSGQGILDVLSMPEKGVLGIFDLMIFRLQCSADRNGDVFNVTRGLSKHGSPTAPTSGLTSAIAIEEMREISQKVFRIFESQYIESDRNFFECVDQLTLSDLTGQFFDYLSECVNSGKISEEKVGVEIQAQKSKIKGFVIYQLANKLVSSGVGCGVYDPDGTEDKNGIAIKMNDYLFDFCFNPKNNVSNYEYFLDFLLLNFAQVFTFDFESSERYQASLGEFVKVLDHGRLGKYWKGNRIAILQQNYVSREKVVRASNYSVSYEVHLPRVFDALDKFVDSSPGHAAAG